MEGQLEHNLEVSLPAAEIWDVYRGLKIGQLCPELVPYLIQKLDVLEGDGGPGTVLCLTFPPETPGFTTWKEKFIKIDDENRIKYVELIEGGLLNLGFSSYKVRFEIIEKGENACIIRSVINYVADTAATASIATTQALELINEAVAKHLLQKKT